MILEAESPYQAMEIGKNIVKGPGWNRKKESVMEEILKEKLLACREYRFFLDDSKDAVLIENTSHEFWGRGSKEKKGENKLGMLHMKLRQETYSHPIPGSQVTDSEITKDHDTLKSYQRDAEPYEPHHTEADRSFSHTAKTHNVLLVGNSQTSHNFNLNHLNRKIHLDKAEAMTIQEARKEISLSEYKDLIVIHEITNDVGTTENSALKCADDMMKLANFATTKADNVIISLGLPRIDNEIKHQLTGMVNHRLMQCLGQKRNIFLCAHNNMLYYGKANSNHFVRDGYHLTTAGKVMFSRNLSSSIHDVTGLHPPSSHRRW